MKFGRSFERRRKMPKKKKMTQKEFCSILEKYKNEIIQFGNELAKAQELGDEWFQMSPEFLAFYKNFKTEEERGVALMSIFFLGIGIGRGMLEIEKMLDYMERGDLKGGNGSGAKN